MNDEKIIKENIDNKNINDEKLINESIDIKHK